MGDHLRKVQSGSPLVIPAAAYNAFIDAAVDYQGRRSTAEQTATPTYQQAGIVLLRNDSGAAVDRFGVLGLGDPIILPTGNEQVFKNYPAFAGVTPDIDDHWNRYIITQQPIAAGAIGRAMVAGVTAVKLDVLTAGVTTATLVNGEKTKLATGPGGAQVLWRGEPAGGYGNEAWAKVLIGSPPGTFFGRVARPENRTMDDCSWIRPGTAGNPPYVYVKCIAPDDTTTGLVVGSATEGSFLKVYLTAGTFHNPSGYSLHPPPEEPNVRQDDVISFVRHGSNYYGVDYPMDRPLGDEKLIFNATLSPGLPRGWYYMESEASVRMPNTSLTALGAEITNSDIRQTLLVVNDENPGDWELPLNRSQGAVGVAIPFPIETEIPPDEGAMGSYHRVAQRVN